MPFLVKEITRFGHQVLVETGAGEYCEAVDSQYERVCATIVPSSEKMYSSAEIVLKIREPQPVEMELIRPDQAIFSFFHFINNPELIKTLAGRGCTCLSYEFVENEHKQYPLLFPIGRITGQMAVLNGAFYLQKHQGGRGIVLGRVTGSPPANVAILGAGNVGRQAAITAANLGARVVILDREFSKLLEIDSLGLPNLSTLISTDENIKELLPTTDLLIACIRVPGLPTPKLITPEMVKTMRAGSVIVEVEIDLGGSVETSKVTHLDNPTFVVDGVVHYCISNITAGVPRIASRAFSDSGRSEGKNEIFDFDLLMEMNYQQIPILTYHKISKNREWGINTVSPKKFTEHLHFLKTENYTPINFRDLSKNELPSNPVIITFDDGYESVFEHAYPALSEFGFTAVVFVITGYIGKWNKWDANLGGIRFRHLNRQQIQELATNNMEIGSHGISHRAFTRLSSDEAGRELLESKS
ncbi:MAG: polysaccharide deacetylase family protein, partial [Calditrichia bacterium]